MPLQLEGESGYKFGDIIFLGEIFQVTLLSSAKNVFYTKYCKRDYIKKKKKKSSPNCKFNENKDLNSVKIPTASNSTLQSLDCH